MNITNKIGEFDFWGMLIPGCATIWALLMLPFPIVASWKILSGMKYEVFVWAVFLVAGYILGLMISMFMDLIWRKFHWRNNPKDIIRAFTILNKENNKLYTKKKFNNISTDTERKYNEMYAQVVKTYSYTPIPSLEKQTMLLRNMIFPSFVIATMSIAKIGAYKPITIIIGFAISIIVSCGFYAMTRRRQLKTYMVVFDYYSTIDKEEN